MHYTQSHALPLAPERLGAGGGGRVGDQYCTEYYSAGVLHKKHEQLIVLADPFEGRKRSKRFCLNFPNQNFVMIFCDTRSKKILNNGGMFS